MSHATLLLELGTAELPPKALSQLSKAFTTNVMAELQAAEIVGQAGVPVSFATPRRLAVAVPKVLAAQPDQQEQRRGPAVAAAFTEDGSPTQAALGFARSCGVDVTELSRLKTNKGEWLSYTLNAPGRSLVEVLPEILENAIKQLPIPKRMRWGDSDAEFVRPVRWLLALHGTNVVPLHLLGVDADRLTWGHRFHSSGPISVEHADGYAQQLLEQGHVIADFAQRRAMIENQINALADSVSGKLADDVALLDEVTALVEYPNALIGTFSVDFLQVPKECLISSMRDHQKYFHLVDASGELMPYFITVSNINSVEPERVVVGNERVLRARLADAQFFWQSDAKNTLAERVEKLGSVTFHAKLGSVLDKTHRLQALAATLAEKLGTDPQMARRAALLCKADLVSNMVNEFDELQGTMGQYYATRDGEPKEVATAIEQHYWPRFAGDLTPESGVAQAVALADRLDSLTGLFAAGEVPTGDKDRYALRRAALGILRILIEREHSLNLSELVSLAATELEQQQAIDVDAALQGEIVGFIRSRLPAFYQGQNVATQAINAVMACEPDSPLDFAARLQAVSHFNDLPEATDLAAANKRISNIFKKFKGQIPTEVDQNLLSEPAEKSLYAALTDLEASCSSLFDAGEYSKGLQQLAGLRQPVDEFFDSVMVMAKEPALQTNRLALLQKMRHLFLRVADISQLQT